VQLAYDIYGKAPFNNKSNRTRTVKVLVDKIARPARSICGSCRDDAAAKGAYRLLGNYRTRRGQKLAERVSREQLWEPVCQHGVKCSSDVANIYSVQDTCALMFPTLKATRGLGTARENLCRTLWMHSAIGVHPDGRVQGLYHAHLWARPPEEFGKGKDNKKRPFEEKESYVWVATAGAVMGRFKKLGVEANLIHVFDRAGDVHEILEWLRCRKQRFIIRVAKKARRIAEEEDYLWPHMCARPVLATQEISIPRTKKGPARKATVEVRSSTVTISPREARNGRKPFEVNVVWVHEPSPPTGVDAIDWMLYTTDPVGTVEDCWAVVNAYKLRWRIEDYHRVLKSDCYAEKTQLKDAEGIVRLLALLAVASMRVLQLRDLARTSPQAPCTTVLEDDEWKVLWTVVHEEPVPRGQAPPTIEEAVKMIGRLGGHLGRKNDGMPGSQTISRGLKELEVAVNVCRILDIEM